MGPNCPDWLRSAVFYQVYPQSFYDSNADGIGDISGIIAKLDYIKLLGCNAIWINPCFVSPFMDAGYDVADFYKVAPRYGTNADLKRLFNTAHKKGMRVCLDLVPGHTSVEHPWFKESCKHEKNKYSNWYVWTDNVWYEGERFFRIVNGYAERNGSYFSNFFYFQPALNYGFAKPDPANPWQLPISHPDVKAVRHELINIMRHWLDMGCDGFRVDMAWTLVKNDPEHRAAMSFWKHVRGIFDRHYPKAVLISEWSIPDRAILGGFHVDFMIHFGTMAWSYLFCVEPHRRTLPVSMEFSYFDRKGKGDVSRFLRLYMHHYRKTRRHGYISLPSGNHDTLRLSIGRTQQDLKVSFAFLMTMPGVPVIYYGDEIGMRYIRHLTSKEGGYDRTGSRTPMQWDSSKNAGFSSAAREKLYLPIDPSADRPTVAAQEKDKNSLLNHIRALLHLRHSSPALGADGEFVPLYGKPRSYPFVYLRKQNREQWIVALNPSGRPVTAEFRLPGLKKSPELVLGRGALVTHHKAAVRVRMEGTSYGVFRLS